MVEINKSIFEKPLQFDPEKELLVLRVNAIFKRDILNAIYFDIHKQIEKGVVMLPAWLDFAIIPKDTEILVEKESNDDQVRC